MPDYGYVSPSAESPTSYVVKAYTMRDLATQSFRLAGGLKQPGQGISASEAQEALDLTNHMIDGWKIENLLIYFFLRTIVNTQNGKRNYSVGPAQDWDIERPEKIHSAGFVLQTDQQTESEIPMYICLTYDEYAQFIAKNTAANIPLALYYQATVPYGTAIIWPVSNQVTQIALYTQGTMQELVTIDDQIITPKGYREMIMYNLAVRIHQRLPYSRVPMDPTVYAYAKDYKTRVMNQQLTPVLLASDPAVLNKTYNYVGGFPRAWTPYT